MDTNNATLQQMLEFLGNYKYESWGFPCFSLAYSQPGSSKIPNHWFAVFRSPKHFINPQIRANSPEDACRQMIEYLKGLKQNEA